MLELSQGLTGIGNRKMAEQENTEDKKPGGKSGMVMMVVVGALAIGGGVATPLLLAQMGGSGGGAAAAGGHTSSTGSGHGSGHGSTDHSAVADSTGGEIPEPNAKTAFIEFEEIVVNLDESRYNRYLKLNFSLQVADSQKSSVERLLEEKKAVLKNWLISHLADKSLEDIRGKFGHNRLRREIHDHFNMTLFDDGIERVQDILFRDINIQ